MPSITINCNAGCGTTLAGYKPPKSSVHQDDLEALMAARSIPIDAAEVDWNCGCTNPDKNRPTMSWVNWTP